MQKARLGKHVYKVGSKWVLTGPHGLHAHLGQCEGEATGLPSAGLICAEKVLCRRSVTRVNRCESEKRKNRVWFGYRSVVLRQTSQGQPRIISAS